MIVLLPHEKMRKTQNPQPNFCRKWHVFAASWLEANSNFSIYYHRTADNKKLKIPLMGMYVYYI